VFVQSGQPVAGADGCSSGTSLAERRASAASPRRSATPLGGLTPFDIAFFVLAFALVGGAFRTGLAVVAGSSGA